MTSLAAASWNPGSLTLRRSRTTQANVASRSDSAPLEDSDRWLLEAAEGNQDSFARLFDAVAPAVLGLTRRVLRDPAMAEEVAQEVMLQVWRTASRFDPERGRATTWILTTAHRRAVDRVRSEEAARTRAVKVGRLEPANQPEPVAEEAVRSDEAARVRRAMALLSDLQRETLELAYYGGLSQSQIARRLETPLGTIKSRMRDGLITLRRAYEESP